MTIAESRITTESVFNLMNSRIGRSRGIRNRVASAKRFSAPMIGLFAMLVIGLTSIGLATAQEPGVVEPTQNPIAEASEIKPDAPFRPKIVIILQVNRDNIFPQLIELQQYVRIAVGDDVSVAFNVGPNSAARHSVVMASAGLDEETVRQVVSRVKGYVGNGIVSTEVLTYEKVAQMYPTNFGESEEITKRYAITKMPAPLVAGYLGVPPLSLPKSLTNIGVDTDKQIITVGLSPLPKSFASINFDTDDHIIIVGGPSIQRNSANWFRRMSSGEIDLNILPMIAGLTDVATDEVRDFVKLNVAMPVGKRRLGAADIAIQKEARRLIATADGQPIQTESTKKLRILVAEAFKVKQTDHRSELESLRTRMLAMESAIKQRDEIADQIIDRRVNELLDLDTEWNPGLALPGNQPAISTSDSTSHSKQVTRYYRVANTDIDVAERVLQTILLRTASGSKAKIFKTRSATQRDPQTPTATDWVIMIHGNSANHYLAKGVIELLGNLKDDGIRIPVKGSGQQFLWLVTKHFDDVDSAHEICSKILEGTADTRISKDPVGSKLIIMTSRNNWDLIVRALAARENSQ